MKGIFLKARAKINLSLDVVGKREDGYHLLQTVMQTLSLYDGIYMKPLQKNEIVLKCNLPWLPTDDRNLTYRAAMLMKQTYGITQGVFIDIDKRIPVAAGLAGGSADCAAVLVGMNRLFSLGLSQRELEGLAAKLGSDIPYCIRRGTVLAEGVGEVLTKIKTPCPPCYVVLAKLPVSVSTVSVYGGLDLNQLGKRPNTQAMIEALGSGEIKHVAGELGNVLESVTIPRHPTIAKLKQSFMEHGACGSLMSGSGPTVFALFEEEKTAKAAAAWVRKEYKLKEVILTKIFPTPQALKGEQKDERNKV